MWSVHATLHSVRMIRIFIHKKVTQTPKDALHVELTEKQTAKEAVAAEVAAATQDKADRNLKLPVALVVAIQQFPLSPKVIDLYTAQTVTETIRDINIG